MPLKTHIDEQPSLNLTPMIDIVFLLIIFFMVGTKFSELERKITLEVPQVAEVKSLVPAPESRVVNVYRNGQVKLDGETVSLDALKSALANARTEYAGTRVLVRGDAEGPFKNVARVLSVCRQAGIDQMGISVRLARRTTSR